MASAGSRGAAVALPRPRSHADHAASSDVATGAWLVAVPCALLTIALVAWLAPPLSHLLYPSTLPVLPTVERLPEPVEDTRYLVSLIGPVLLAGSVALLAPRLRIGRRAATVLAVGAQLVAFALVVACFVRQPDWQEIPFFRDAQLVGAGVLAVALALAARRGWLTGWRPEPRALRIALPVIGIAIAAIWFLSFLQNPDTMVRYGDPYNTAFIMDETFAVLNGLTPLVDHAAAYEALWPFVLAPLAALLGKTLLVWTLLMWALTLTMLLAIYGVLRRVTRSAIAAFALFLPLMAFIYFSAVRDPGQPIAIYQQVPLRNAAPFLVAYLVARRLERGRGAIWPLGLACGLAVLNNVDFGVAALGATIAALLFTQLPPTRARLGRLAARLAVGLAGAYVLVAVVTLLRAGALPNPLRAVEFARIYSRAGVGMAPLGRVLGLPLVVYFTYAAAIGVATVRALRGARDQALTGMLAWSAIFGFGSAAYYMGASTILAVATLFPAWGLSLALLAVVAVRRIASRRERLPSVPALAALFGIGLLATFLAIPPTRLEPWSQVDRLSEQLYIVQPSDAEPLAAPHEPRFRRYVSTIADGRDRFVVRHEAPVALFMATGHLLADAYDLRDVVPYTGRSVFTQDQFDDAIGRLRAAGGNTVLVPRLIVPRIAALLSRRGFELLTRSGYRALAPGEPFPEEAAVVRNAADIPDELTKWVDGRALPATAG